MSLAQKHVCEGVLFYQTELHFPHLVLTTLFLSPAGHMTDLIYAEKDLVQALKEYILAEEDKLSKIKRCTTPTLSWPLSSQDTVQGVFKGFT